MRQAMRLGALLIGSAVLFSTTLASADPPRAEAAPPSALEPTRVHSPALTAGGAVLGTVGIASLVGGLAVLGIDSQQSSHSGPPNPDSFPDLSAILYVPLIIHGVACIAGGA